jgi:anti-anti-sigma regulatory factor
MRRVWRVYDDAKDELQGAFREQLQDHPDFGPLLEATPDDDAEQAERHALLGAAMERGEWEPYWYDVIAQAAGYAHAEISLASWIELIHMVRVDVLTRILEARGIDPDEIVDDVRALDRWLDDAMGVFSQAFVDANEQVIARQQQSIRQLSMPVLQLRPGLLLLPLVGAIDYERLGDLQAGMLEAIHRRRARVVVIDVTGVPEVDSVAANRLVSTVSSARMMGAEVIVSGLSGEIAQTLVTVGVDLSGIRSAGDLQSGIDLAEQHLRD